MEFVHKFYVLYWACSLRLQWELICRRNMRLQDVRTMRPRFLISRLPRIVPRGHFHNLDHEGLHGI